MRILQLTNKVPYPPRDGGAIASLTLAKGLAEAGHEVTLLAMNTTKHFVTEKDDASRPDLPIRWEIVAVDTRVKWHRALVNLLFSRLPYNAERFISSEYRIRLVSLLKEDHYDAILLDNLYTGLYLNDIRNTTRSPVVLRAHNVEHEIWHRNARSATGLQRIYLTILASRIRRFEHNLINRYDAIVPISDRDASHFQRYGNRKPVLVLPAAMQVSPNQPPSRLATPVTVAHLGALDWMPNQTGIRWFIREVWPLIREAVPNIEFHLAGRNAPPGFGHSVSAPGVVFHGEIEDAAEFISRHPIFIVPLFSGSGMRIKLLDYMASGRAVVSTTIGAEGIPVENGKHAFIADQPAEFAGLVIRLAGDPDSRTLAGNAARAFISEQYDNRALTLKLTRFLESIDNRS